MNRSSWTFHLRAASFTLVLALALALTSACATQHWYKGNVHCHSLWSDGNSFPDYVADWYKSRGYNFLALTDHNVFQEGEKWMTVGARSGRGVAAETAYKRYKERLGLAVQEREQDGKKQVRLKTFAELEKQFGEPGKFLMIPAEEITTGGPGEYRVHMVVANIAKVIPPIFAKEGREQAGTWTADANARQIEEQRKATGRLIHGHLNHPLWSHMPFEEVCAVTGFNQTEINNDDSGDAKMLPVTEKLWDTAIADRIKKGAPLMLALAVDDAHNHLTDANTPFGAGHGWIVIRARSLTPESVVKAIDAGEFYSTRGPDFLDIRREARELALKIKPAAGITFKTEFVGMRKGGQPGEVLATSTEMNPVYKMKGDELYMRAKVTSSKARKNEKGGIEYYEMAWTQPYQPGK